MELYRYNMMCSYSVGESVWDCSAVLMYDFILASSSTRTHAHTHAHAHYFKWVIDKMM